MSYLVVSAIGQTGSPWGREFSTLPQALSEVRKAMGWDGITCEPTASEHGVTLTCFSDPFAWFNRRIIAPSTAPTIIEKPTKGHCS